MMALAPLTRCNRCRQATTRNRPAICDDCEPAARVRDQRPSSSQRGYGRRWRKYRLAVLAESPLCVACRRVGRVAAATVVDHIEPHRGDLALFWVAENHQPLCVRCHNRKTGQGQ